MHDKRGLIEECCGWNRKMWADALEFAISGLSEDLDGKKVLEIGASGRSSVAPLFAAMGADVVCSCYGLRKTDIEDGQLALISNKYGIRKARVIEMDANDIGGVYDIIVMKSVLGGICRNDDYGALRGLVKNLAGHLAEFGQIITLDNGYVKPLELVRHALGTGGGSWTYIREDNWKSALSDFRVTIKGFGFLNCVSAAPLLGTRFEVLNDLIYAADRILAIPFGRRGSAVLATVIERPPGR